MCSSLSIHVRTRSTPRPKPLCGTVPHFLSSMYHLIVLGVEVVVEYALEELVVVVYALAASDDLPVTLGG